jgi:hypothetical protein
MSLYPSDINHENRQIQRLAVTSKHTHIMYTYHVHIEHTHRTHN